ncbi:precorrin-6y C5,15-methyltransferase (decarboxylating) subunit CbiE [Lichenihabitans sp. PAMC28606]|uniref:precorrin-6y C5,15-methyltransferase (decarboxylating) subunit CbiE n=1 Tax=Lichenihabitans sp. PAMC28606 TaxID=2880932 RepID=UPI001D0AE023|nr:precorrin-6y C5,15-methyltransferase (decarboxylating) subunit CbiE [Lichenihabitans sp. PAMC28606]UDL94985.1 precorrin-6y C5,15-methyltransferase (decarboxylating) subunit CbiE [Lichenihabitans sp. PAMC28606]
MKPAPWLTLVGIGEDGLDGLSSAARRAVMQAELVVGGRRHLALVGDTPGTHLPWGSPIEATFPAILSRRGSAVCVLASGDPFHYGIGSILARHVDPGDMTCLPHASSFSLAAARLGWALQDCGLVTLHGRPLDRVVPLLRPGKLILALSWDETTPAALAALLVARGYALSRLTILEAMGGPRERITSALARDVGLDRVDPLNVVAVEVLADATARVPPMTPGLPDDWFEHDGQITKSRMRALTLSALAPQPGGLLWDVGAGSGSVGIEWMMSCPDNRTIAIEADPVRASRVARNAASFGLADLRVVEGRAPDGLQDLPRPDAIFIGGGVTSPGLLDFCLDALAPGGRLVANVVTLEGQMLLGAAFAAHGGDLVTVNIAQADPVGRFHGWRAAMPVTQWVWVKP